MDRLFIAMKRIHKPPFANNDCVINGRPPQSCDALICIPG